MLNVETTRLVGAAGAIKASPGRLAWLIISNSHSSDKKAVHLNNDTDGTDDEIGKFYCPPQATVVFAFDPPIVCTTGIYIGTFESTDLIVTGGYD